MQNEHQKWIAEVGCSESDWVWFRQTGYLPTHEGETPDADA